MATDAYLSKWERWLARMLSGGAVRRPGEMYRRMLRRAARRRWYRRTESALGFLCIVFPTLRVLGAHESLLFVAMLVYAGAVLPLWVGFGANQLAREVLSTERMEELVLTPLRVNRVAADIRVFGARRVVAPLAALWCAWVATVLIGPMDPNVPGELGFSFVLWGLGLPIAGLASYFGTELSLGTITWERLLRKAGVAGGGALRWVIVPLLVLAAVGWAVGRISASAGWAVGGGLGFLGIFVVFYRMGMWERRGVRVIREARRQRARDILEALECRREAGRKELSR